MGTDRGEVGVVRWAGPDERHPVGAAPENRAPRRRPGIIERDGVVKRLLDADAELVVVCAPPGYGKTTTVALWGEADGRPFVWVHLDRADDDPVHLLRHVAASLAILGPLDDATMAVVDGPGRSPTTEVLPAVLAAIAERSPLVLVFDDVHLLTSRAVVACVESLIDKLATGSALTLVGRSATPFHLARRRVNGQLHEIGPIGLAMSCEEARLAFGRAGLVVDDDVVATLVERTEGWPAALHLAALRLADSSPEAPVPFLTGRDRLVADYLVDEVLDGLSATTVSFLERSAILDRMTASQLDALLDTDDAAMRLAEVERSGNLFLVPLDTEGCWYRYHHLFGELLRSRLEGRDVREAQRLHRRAGELAALDGDIDAAVHHLVAGGDQSGAADLVAERAAGLVLHGRVALVERWLHLLGPEAMDDQPAAALSWAWVGIGTADRVVIDRAMDSAARLLADGPSDSARRNLADGLSVLRAISWAGPIDEMVDGAVDAVADGDPRSPWWALAGSVRGTVGTFRDQIDEARADLERTAGGLVELPAFHAVALAHLGVLALDDGDRKGAERCGSQAMRIAHDHRLEGLPAAMTAFAGGALTAALGGRQAEARAEAAIATNLLDRLGGIVPRTALFGNVLLARTALALDDRTGATDHLRRAEALTSAVLGAPYLDRQVDDVRSALAADRAWPGRPTLTTAELRVLVVLPTHLSLQEIADKLYLSRNTIKTHSVSIYRKLGAGSRGEAVSMARDLGLLAP